MLSQPYQCTLAQPVSRSGVGLHTGADCTVHLSPLECGAGLQFLLPRQDAPRKVTIEARRPSSRCTALGWQDCEVMTVEHLLSALMGCGIDNCLIEASGGEAPALDGSALPWVEAIHQAGIVEQSQAREYLAIAETVWLDDKQGTLVVLPCDDFRVTYGIDFSHRVLGRQVFSATINRDLYERDIAPARTFGFLHEVEDLRRQGLALGGCLDNAVVIGDEDYLTPLRFEDEPVRHKVLDLVGDLALLGRPLKAQIIALKTSHYLNTELVKKILETRRD